MLDNVYYETYRELLRIHARMDYLTFIIVIGVGVLIAILVALVMLIKQGEK